MRSISSLALGLTFVLSVTFPLSAQTPAGEISGGWSFVHSLDLTDTELDVLANMPLGFVVGGAGRVTDVVGIAGELAWNRKEENLFGFDTRLTVTTYSAGPRLYFGDRVTGFVHALFGGIRAEASVSFLGEEGSESDTELLIQPGGGVDIRAGDHFAVRLQADYQWINAEETDGNLRFVVAAVFYLGER